MRKGAKGDGNGDGRCWGRRKAQMSELEGEKKKRGRYDDHSLQLQEMAFIHHRRTKRAKPKKVSR